MRKLLPFWIVALSLVITSCGSKYIINKTYKIPNGEWTYADSLRYEFKITDTLQIYNLIVTLKHGRNFAFQNIYTLISTQFPDGRRLSKPLSLELANKAGQWQGKCGAKYCIIIIPIQQGAYFNEPGKYVVTLEQYMRMNPVKDIQSINFKIKETEKKRKEAPPKSGK